MKIILGDYSPTTGVRHANRRLNIGYFTQHHVDQLEMDQSPLELVAERFPGKNQEDYRAALGRFGLSGDVVLQLVVTLSGGKKSRLAFPWQDASTIFASWLCKSVPGLPAVLVGSSGAGPLKARKSEEVLQPTAS